MNTMCNVSELL